MKYKNGLVTEAEAEIKAQENQETLKEKHHIVDENVVVVEKNNYLRLLAGFIHTLATILLVILATAGCLSIVYPQPREALFAVLSQIYSQVVSMFS